MQQVKLALSGQKAAGITVRSKKISIIIKKKLSKYKSQKWAKELNQGGGI